MSPPKKKKNQLSEIEENFNGSPNTKIGEKNSRAFLLASG